MPSTIQARLLQEDPRFLLLEVSDTGCGISPEMTERIFERLYQVSERIQASRKGLGLGLYICKELVTRQGGQIWVKRQPQKGTTFSFTLPVFSLTSLIAPLLKNDKWPAESVALVMVEIRLLDAWPSKESQEEWSQEARGLIQRCFLPDLDVLLPKMSTGTEENASLLPLSRMTKVPPYSPTEFGNNSNVSPPEANRRDPFGFLQHAATVTARCWCIHGRSRDKYGHKARRIGQISHHLGGCLS